VLDKFKGEKNNGWQFIFAADDNLNIDHIYYSSKGRENFDRSFAMAKEQEEIITQKDRLNVLYVALTRAIDGLIVIQKSKASRFNVLGLKDTIKGNVNPMVDKRTETIDVNRSVSISNYGIQENIQKTQNAVISYESVIFGAALHYALEMIEEFHIEHIDMMMSLVGYKYGRLLGNDKLFDIRRRVEALLASPEFNELLHGAKVYRELPISFYGELKQIDILLEYNDRCVVVDYKSSGINNPKHKEQVALYAEAITTIKQKPCECKILYLLENSVEIISLKQTKIQ
jgi:exodeoxyribonuclease V beta subunit